MPPRPANATELELKIFEMCDRLVAQHRDDCHKWFFAAIIDRAIRDYCSRAYQENTTSDISRAPHLIHQHASDWIFGREHLEYHISFEEVCEPLGVNVESLRKMLRQLTEGT